MENCKLLVLKLNIFSQHHKTARKGLDVHSQIIEGYLQSEPSVIQKDKDVVVWLDIVPNRTGIDGEAVMQMYCLLDPLQMPHPRSKPTNTSTLRLGWVFS